jgi:hypothetical protein
MKLSRVGAVEQELYLTDLTSNQASLYVYLNGSWRQRSSFKNIIINYNIEDIIIAYHYSGTEEHGLIYCAKHEDEYALLLTTTDIFDIRDYDNYFEAGVTPYAALLLSVL